MATQAGKQQGARLPSEVRVDPAGRLVLGKALSGRLFKVVESDNGEIRLVPARIVADAEAWFFANPDRVASMDRSLAESEAEKAEETTLEELAGL